MHLPVIPYAYGTGQDRPSQFDDQFEGPTTESNPLKKLEQDLLNEEARYDSNDIHAQNKWQSQQQKQTLVP